MSDLVAPLVGVGVGLAIAVVTPWLRDRRRARRARLAARGRSSLPAVVRTASGVRRGQVQARGQVLVWRFPRQGYRTARRPGREGGLRVWVDPRDGDRWRLRAHRLLTGEEVELGVLTEHGQVLAAWAEGPAGPAPSRWRRLGPFRLAGLALGLVLVVSAGTFWTSWLTGRSTTGTITQVREQDTCLVRLEGEGQPRTGLVDCYPRDDGRAPTPGDRVPVRVTGAPVAGGTVGPEGTTDVFGLGGILGLLLLGGLGWPALRGLGRSRVVVDAFPVPGTARADQSVAGAGRSRADGAVTDGGALGTDLAGTDVAGTDVAGAGLEDGDPRGEDDPTADVVRLALAATASLGWRDQGVPGRRPWGGPAGLPAAARAVGGWWLLVLPLLAWRLPDADTGRWDRFVYAAVALVLVVQLVRTARLWGRLRSLDRAPLGGPVEVVGLPGAPGDEGDGVLVLEDGRPRWWVPVVGQPPRRARLAVRGDLATGDLVVLGDAARQWWPAGTVTPLAPEDLLVLREELLDEGLA